MKLTDEEIKILVKTLKEKVPDFSLKVAHIYELLGWGWATMKGEIVVPTAIVIRGELYRMIDSMTEHKSTHYTGGGLGIEFEKNKDKSIAAYLYFKLEEYCIPEQ